MFTGYSEIAAYCMDPASDSQGTSNGMEDENLPTEYLPIYNPPDPWSRLTDFQTDFILIAEFSEMEGPKPLITIPKNFGGSFDLNDFSVRIMSVDHQAVARDTFFFQEDTQLLMTELRHNIYAYVHHFTLYDSQARGFVRPFCMSYVATDQRKLMSFYEELSTEFSRVSERFKYGNLMLFVKDMTNYLTDLQYTKQRLQEVEKRKEKADDELGELEEKEMFMEDPDESNVLNTTTIQSVENCILEVKNIIDLTSKLLGDKGLEERFKHYEEKCKADKLDIESSHGDSASFSGSPRLTPEHLLKTKKKRSGSYSDLDSAQFDTSDIPYKPKLVRTTNRRRFDKALRTLHELCQWGAKEGLNGLRNLHKCFSRDLATQLIERKESNIMDPPSSLLTVGRNVTINFMHNISLDDTFPIDKFSRQKSTGSELSGRVKVRRWLSDETLESFKSAESFLSCVDDDCGLSDRMQEIVFIRGSAYREDRRYSTSSCQSEPVSIGADSSFYGDASVSDMKLVTMSYEGRYSESINSDADQSSLCISDSEGNLDGSDEDNAGRGSGSEGISIPTPNSGHVHPISVVSAADHITQLAPNVTGYGILAFVRKYAFSPHVIYSLLSGRPVVVIGSKKAEADVRKTVNTLSLFVAGHSSHSIVPWHKKQLKITDLSKFKIIGLWRPDNKTTNHVIPNAVRRYVTMLDIERSVLVSPTYKGGKLTALYSKQKYFKTEEAYVAFVHSVILEIACKAQILYHSFYAQRENSKQKEFDKSPLNADFISTNENDIFANMKENAQDAKIIKHFVDVILNQQATEFQNHRDQNPFNTVKLDYSKCTLFSLK